MLQNYLNMRQINVGTKTAKHLSHTWFYVDIINMLLYHIKIQRAHFSEYHTDYHFEQAAITSRALSRLICLFRS